LNLKILLYARGQVVKVNGRLVSVLQT
jgi:hypothetical protein